MLGLLDIDQPDVNLVNQRRGLQGLARLFLGHLLSGQAAEFLIDQRQKLLGRLWVALLDGRKDSGDLVHRMYPSVWGARVGSILADQPEVASTAEHFLANWASARSVQTRSNAPGAHPVTKIETMADGLTWVINTEPAVKTMRAASAKRTAFRDDGLQPARFGHIDEWH